MKVVIIGGTGLVGRQLAAKLKSDTVEVIAASPSTGVNSVTGYGLAEALAGADTVVDVSNSPSFEDQAVLDFFRRSTSNLLEAAKAAGVKHYVALSVVGADRIQDSPYLRAKRAQEIFIETGGIPYTIVRATQFYEFLEAIADAATQEGAVRVSGAKFQPVAASDVAATLADVISRSPVNGAVELAGPEPSTIAEAVAAYLEAKGDTRRVIRDHEASYFGAVLDEHGLAPKADFIPGTTRLSDWLRSA